MKCLPHKDEGLVKDENGNDKWPKVKPSRNEKDMFYRQQGTWDYKSDGIKQLKYEFVNIEEINPKAKNDKCKVRCTKRRTK